MKITEPEKKLRKIREGSREWRRREKEIVELYAPPIANCKDCGSPRHAHYCCYYCGSGR